MPRTLTKKVLLGAGIWLALLSITSILAFRDILAFHASVSALVEKANTRTKLTGDFSTSLVRALVESEVYAKGQDDEDLEEARDALALASSISVQLEVMARDTSKDVRIATSENGALEQRRRDLVVGVHLLIGDLTRAVQAHDQPAIADLTQEIDKLEAAHAQLEAETSRLFEADVSATNAAIGMIAQRGLFSVAISFTTFVVILSIALVVLRRNVVHPIAKLSIAANIVADGDLEQTVAITNNDEIGNLQRAFSQMVGSLRAQRTAFQQRTEAEQARAAAEQASRSKSAFLASMSHELRTPLSAIIGYSELIQTSASTPDQLALLPDVQKIQQAGRHLLAIINDILDVSKIEAGKMQLALETFAIQPLIDEVVTTIQPLVAKNGNRLHVRCAGDLGSMHADPTRVRQVLFNLLSNAAKFTEQGVITLGVDRIGPSADQIRYQVVDTGIGMSPEQLARLFQPFTQASAKTSRLYGGTGLGLTLSQHLCRMMGGEISVASASGQGSTFTAVIPATVGHPAPVVSAPHEPVVMRHEPAQPAPTTGGTLVLVIDDDPAACELVTRSLECQGHTIVAATGGEEGLQLARDLLPEMIILDVLMPGMDGWAVLSALKADPETQAIPVVMLTIVDEPEVGFTLGAADYLLKPVERERLGALLRKYQSAPPAAPPTAAEILIVEDDQATRELLQRTVEADGWSTIGAATAQAALSRIGAAPPDLIMADLTLPDMDGVQLIDAIRASDAGRSIPIVVITARDLTAAERERLNGSVAQILQKGTYRFDDLLREVQLLIANHTRHASAPLLETSR